MVDGAGAGSDRARGGDGGWRSGGAGGGRRCRCRRRRDGGLSGSVARRPSCCRCGDDTPRAPAKQSTAGRVAELVLCRIAVTADAAADCAAHLGRNAFVTEQHVPIGTLGTCPSAYRPIKLTIVAVGIPLLRARARDHVQVQVARALAISILRRTNDLAADQQQHVAGPSAMSARHTT